MTSRLKLYSIATMKSQSRFKTGSPLRESFPKNVLREAEKFGSHIKQQDTIGREDCRSDSVISIDPASALDLDDAFSLQRTRGKRWKLRVHVADVSHYVKANSLLDREARLRGNSTYLVDRVIPMLPSSLSNGLCSLHPDSDRLTKCVEFTLTSDGKVLGTISSQLLSDPRDDFHTRRPRALSTALSKAILRLCFVTRIASLRRSALNVSNQDHWNFPPGKHAFS